ncbi:mammalian cell entry-like protein [Rodentibacter pneumotropicus]|uniref:Mammalian cell entry-like protein n=1 Tax=Rodentibacter pneumotropicus TaxID=758 RepID=A0A3S4TZS1_9PAST|nr:mammalian cell entry-like protein [Rodentibacter pneumotropicus]
MLYRQYEVGKITNIQPQTNHFNVDVYIYPPYKHLLTDKSVFWVESAAQVDITPKGISIQATPIARSLKGAISFDNSSSGKIKHCIQMSCEQNLPGKPLPCSQMMRQI